MDRPPEDSPPDHDAPPPSPEEAAARRRLEKAGAKLIAIALFSAFVPLAGAAFAGFALVAGRAVRRRAAAFELPTGRTTAAMAIALASLAWQGVLAWRWLGPG